MMSTASIPDGSRHDVSPVNREATMDDYAHFHRDRRNLLIHVVAVPVFVVGTLAALRFLLAGQGLAALAWAVGPVLSLAAQGRGHRLEPNPPRPFRGPVDFVRRILAEQFVRFPLFLASGRWARALRAGRLSPPA
jgi:hypothetical protein